MEPDLSKLRIIEVGTAISVPLMGEVLSNLGAEVIKVESIAKLDGNRARLPANSTAGVDADKGDLFPVWHDMNAGKKSVTLNLKSEVGRELFLDLIRQSDVFIQNFASGWLERADLSGALLHEVNPRLIMMFATGYGQDGPRSAQRVYAPVMTALGGMESLIGDEHGEVFGAMPLAFGDFNSTYWGLSEIFAALYLREETGQGAIIDMSQIEAVVASLGEGFVEMQMTGKAPVPVGNRFPYRAPHAVYPALGADRWVTISVAGVDEWRALVREVSLDNQEWASQLSADRWLDPARRIEDRDQIDRFLSQWTAGFDRLELAERLQSAGVRAAPVLEADEVENDPHLVARGFRHDVDDALGRRFSVTATPWRFDGATPHPMSAGPSLGQSTEQVLHDLCDVSLDSISRFSREGHLA